jgi:phage shock protein PspC (stress-responsive transcriptional regulator)
MENRLMRSESNRMIAGVCGGLGAHLGIDPTVVRLAFLLLVLASGVGIVLYIVLAIIMPSGVTTNVATGKTVERNIEDLGESISKSIGQLEESRRGPMIVAGLLIFGGVYLLLGNLGINLNLGLIVSIGLIGGGIWLVTRDRHA